jgi:A/G-specific adenine glycosylase
VLLRTRPYKGLLGGMTELPGTEWRNTPWTLAEALTVAPMQLASLNLAWRGAGQVRHGFTHFELIIDVLAAQVPRIEAEGFAHPLDALDDAALPSVMRKCVRIARSEKA